jgi:uncharacterized protein
VDVVYTLEGIRFTWDPRKALANIRRHGVTFETAAEVFLDPFLRVVEIQEEEDEEREAVIGMTMAWQILFVVYITLPTAFRLISAREVTKAERKRYEDG